MSEIKLFVYGLLKSGNFFYETYLKNKIIKQYKAYTFGELYFLPNFSCPALCEGKNKIFGELFIFKDPDILKLTDEFEEYDEKSESSSIFKRKQIKIYYENDIEDIAFAYVMNKEDILKYGGMKIEKGSF